jgi:EmrB/QacA subfamily drug resistance transporter
MASTVPETHGGPPPPLERKVLVVAAIVVLGAIMTVLDATIVSVAIETLSRDFGSPLATIQWVMTGYVLALAAVIPITGWAADRFGSKNVWMTSLVFFVGGSLLCGLAWDATSLIIFRILQGLGGGMVVPAGMTLVAQAAGPQRMGRAMSIIGVPMMLGPVLGPILGGVLVSSAPWQWIFFINLPVGAAALLWSWRAMENTPGRRSERLDLLGLALLSPSLALLVFGVSELSGPDGFGSPGTLIGLFGGLALLVLFCLHALRAKQPLLDLRHFAKRAFAAAGTIQTLMGSTLHGTMLVLPLFYQLARGESPAVAGLLLVPQGVGAAVSMSLTGKIVDRGHGRAVLLTGLPLIVLGFGVFTQATTGTSYVLTSAALFVIGLGTGCMMSPVAAAAYQSVDRKDIPRATSTLNITQRVGGAIGTALYAVVLDHNLSGAHSKADIAGAFDATFWWAVGLTALAILPALLLPAPPAKPKQPSAQAPGRVAEPATK